MKLSNDWETMLGRVPADSKRRATYYFPGPKDTILLVLIKGRVTLRTPSQKLTNDEQELLEELSNRLSALTKNSPVKRLIDVAGEGELYEYSFTK